MRIDKSNNKTLMDGHGNSKAQWKSSRLKSLDGELRFLDIYRTNVIKWMAKMSSSKTLTIKSSSFLWRDYVRCKLYPKKVFAICVKLRYGSIYHVCTNVFANIETVKFQLSLLVSVFVKINMTLLRHTFRKVPIFVHYKSVVNRSTK